MAATLRNVLDNQPHFPLEPRDYEVSVHPLDIVLPVENDGDWFFRAVSVILVVDTAQSRGQAEG